MHGRRGGRIQQVAAEGLGVQQPVVAAFHPLAHPGLQPGQGLRQQGLAAGAGLQLQSRQPVGSGGKGCRNRFIGPLSRPEASTLREKASPTCSRLSIARSLATATVKPGG